MAKAPEDTKPESWQRFFAVTANNQAWDVAELPSAQVDKLALLNAAHASAWHWQAAGNELNHKRALMLLSQAHAVAGLGQSALLFAEEMRAYFLGEPSTPDWEVALTHAIHANAAHAAGKREHHQSSYALAQSAMAAIADPEDKAIVVRLFEQVPRP
ncbi:hypothetical protein [Piscinibacter sp. HJYY11]|uniref:hypothetical protein n=1 Tax=Piscinibacter sp. HJYY11 TaxID=2801333 RepID=UPI00191D107A|nr:hypothetical protein [Piscinibacter sp. HJYY11]MBL0726084.1 hypothetical protein [Piscinibacter sp. HJYY11]